MRSTLSIRSRVWCACLLLICVSLGFGLLPSATGQTDAVPASDLIAQASAARTQNDIPRAIELYSKAVARNPNWADGWWFLGSLEYGTGAYVPAGAALSHYVDMVPAAGPAYALRGLCEFENSQ